MKTHLLEDKILFSSVDYIESKNYWLKRFSHSSIDNGLNFIDPNWKQTERFAFTIEKHISLQIIKLCKQNDLSMYIYLLTVYAILINRYSDADEIIIASPHFNGELKKFPKETNVLIPIFCKINREKTFKDILIEIRSAVINAIQNQHYPLKNVYEELGINGINLTSNAAFSYKKINNEIKDNDYRLFMLNFDLIAEEIVVEISSSAKVNISPPSIFNHLNNIVHSSLNDINIVVNKLELLDITERRDLLERFQGDRVPLPTGATLVSMFGSQAKLSPGSLALVYEGRELSYGDLDALSDRLGCYLRDYGVGRDVLVPLCIERGIEMVVGILGILKAGGAYVPIDPEYPMDRISYILEDTGGKVLLSSTGVCSRITFPAGLSVLVLDGAEREWDYAQAETSAQPLPGSSDLAYVIYTSGSTGRPKGVMIEHRNVVHYLRNKHTDYVGDGKPGQRGSYLQLSYGFDASVTSLFMPLVNGMSVVLGCGDDLSLFTGADFIRYAPYSFLKLTPSQIVMLEESIKDYPGRIAEKLVLGGESLYGHQLSSIVLSRISEVINEYGPTETTVGCTTHRVQGGTEFIRTDSVPIGRPIANTRIYILDRGGMLCPVGVPGELYIGGAGVGRGYLNQAELSSEKFIGDRFSGEGKMYRTGDIGRWLNDGNIEFQGRNDDQVKIRGYRIELGEIESVISESGYVRQSLVLAESTEDGSRHLVCYVVGSAGYDRSSLRSYLEGRLPGYMIPGIWQELDYFPLTVNGKVDRKSLPGLVDIREVSSGGYVAPETAMERQVSEIWEELLGVDGVGVDDNFFELGGDSIITIQISSRLKREGYTVHARDIFRHPTVRGLSVVLAQRELSSEEDGSPQVITGGSSGLLPIQSYYLGRSQVSLSHYNQSVVIWIDKAISFERILKSLEELSLHHESLRMGYNLRDGVWLQEYGVTVPEGLLYEEDVHDLPLEELESGIDRLSLAHQGLLDIGSGLVFRGVLFQTGAEASENRLLLIVHHLSVDGVSWRILLEDLDRLLSSGTGVYKGLLGRKSSSIQVWYEELRSYGLYALSQGQDRYWSGVLSHSGSLPVDNAYPGAVRYGDMGFYDLRFDSSVTRQLLQQAPEGYHTEINDLLLTALSMTLYRWRGMSSVVIGLEGHGREDIGGTPGVDISRTLGWFTNLYPQLLECAGYETTGDWIKGIKEQLRNVPDKGMGYGVLHYMASSLSGGNSSPWELVFNYLGQLDMLGGGSDHFGHIRGGYGSISAEYIVDERITVNGMISGGELVLSWGYSRHHYEWETIRDIAEEYQSSLREVLACCLSRLEQGSVYTPSDYGLSPEVSYQELDEFMLHQSSIERIYRLSPLQEGMMFHSLYAEGGSAYLIQLGCEVRGMDRGLLLKSWEHLLRQHSILRSSFYHDAFKIGVQCVYKEVSLPVEDLDYRDLETSLQEAGIRAYVESDRDRGMRFESAPLMRLALLRLSEDRYYMLWTHHHVLLDGWSLPVLLGNLLRVYEVYQSGGEAVLEPDYYEDYIRYIGAQQKRRESAYWREYLRGVSGASLLPFVSVSASDRTKGVGKFVKYELRLDDSERQSLSSYSQRHHVTVNTMMQGVWSYLLSHYTGEADVLYGITVSGRPEELPGVEHRVGMYINTLPFRSRVDGSDRIVDWLTSIQSEQLSSRDYQHTSIKDIQGWISVREDLFDSILIFENYPVDKDLQGRNWALQLDKVEVKNHGNYPLEIVIVSTASETVIRFSYNSRLLEASYIEKISGHFRHVLEQLSLSGPDQRVGELELLDITERRDLLERFQGDRVPLPTGATLVSMFGSQAKLSPGSLALVYEGRELSYGDLDALSDRLGCYLRDYGVGRDVLVPLCIERGIEMVVGILGILKAGGAYVPIDPEYPMDRISYILEDTGGKVLLSSTGVCSRITFPAGLSVLVLDGAEREWDYAQAETSAQPLPGSSDLAYVIYTSGSTGRPKGVMIEHRNVVNTIIMQQVLFDISADDRALQFASCSFDASVSEIFAALICGAGLYIISDSERKQADSLQEYIVKHQITIATIPPAYLQLLDITQLGGIKSLITAGEAVLKDTVADFPFYGNYYNAYGPTETSICATIFKVSKGSNIEYDSVPIGRPIANTRIYILDRGGMLCPVGVPGELYIGGAGVGRGYLNQAELSSEKFIGDRFSGEGKMYRTGDIGRWLNDGNIEFQGRNDDQVKIRGYRIELGEIESVISESGYVRQSLVLAESTEDGSRHLVCYVVGSAGYDRSSLRSYLEGRLPGYMIPGIWQELDYFPLTVNGKVDRKSLPGLVDIREVSSGGYVAPETAMERQVSEIWEELLGVDGVGVDDNFFELGGHSLLAIRLIAAIRKEIGAGVSMGDIFDYPTLRELSAKLSEHLDDTQLPSIGVYERPDRVPLSYSQERLWFIDQLEGSVQYHIPAALRIEGDLDVGLLTSSLRKIVERHEVLRTVIRSEEGVGYQVVLPSGDWALREEGFKRAEEVRELLSSHTGHPFDLSSDYMLRGWLYEIGSSAYMLVLTIHHIASDGWSVPILIEELKSLYNSGLLGEACLLPELPVQYADYSLWQRSYLSGDLLSTKLGYWQEALSGLLPLDLPTDHLRPALQGRRGSVCHFHIGAEISAGLTDLGLGHGSTLFMTLLSGLQVLLYRYSGQSDICVGSPVANREQHEIGGLIGFFVNTLALRVQVDGRESFLGHLDQVRRVTLGAYEHQDVPFEKVVDGVSWERDPGRSPLFQVSFTLHNDTPGSGLSELSGLTLTQETLSHTTSKYDLSFEVTPGLSGLDGVIEYNTDLYEAETIRRMGDHYKMLLSSIVADPSCPVNKLELLDITERRDLLERFQGDRVPLPTGATLVSMFGSQAKLSPGSLALVYEGRELSYGDLDALSDRLGCYLRDYGVGRDVLVPLCIERGIEMVVGILGILKAGGAYVPIDPEYPMDRISYILEDTGGKVLLSSTGVCSRITFPAGLSVLVLDGAEREWDYAQAETSAQPLPGSSDLAYVIYTSGSTGRPKGVMIEHRNVVNTIIMQQVLFDISADDRALQFASCSFDASVWEIFAALICGAGLYIISDSERKQADSLQEYIVKHQITIATIPPAYLQLLDITQLGGIKSLITAGEAVLKDTVADFPFYGNYYNAYGPTETSICATIFKVSKGSNIEYDSVPIGRPIANTRIYILDRGGMLCPVGVPGELYIGGAGVGRGYLNQAELSSEKFIGDRFSGEGKMYRTGDIGRWLNDGNIEFQGRNDDQVKIRGYRIELGEIENALNTYGGIKQSVVQSLESEAGDKYLVGYYVSETAIDELMLRAHLVRYLPQYMIPGYLVHLEKLPLTVNGKVDRKSLPGLVDIREVSSGGYVAPETAMERQVSEIWEELLGVDGVGVDDNFFELGGHSLLAIRLIAAIRKEIGAGVSMGDIFDYPTLRELSAKLSEHLDDTQLPSIGVYERPDRVPLSYSQERLWFIDQLEGSVQYHIPAALRIEGDLDVGLLTSSLRKIVERHEVLRTVIRSEEGVGYQVVLPSGDWALREEGFKRAEEVRELLSSHTGHPFDLSSDYMLRGWLYEIGSSAYMLVLTIHHIASDGWSVPILIEELKSLYNSGLLGEACLLPELPVQYADYSLWQRSYLSGDLLSTKLGYWQEALSGLLPLDLPTDHLRPALQGRRGSVCHFHIGAEISAGLTDLGLGHGSTLFMTLLSGLQVLLYRYSGQSDICVGSPVANREQHEIGGLIGFFVNTLALRVQVDGRESFLGHLDQVRRVTLGAYEHQDVPFEKVVDGVSWERDPGRSPLFQVLFTLQHNDTPGSSGLSELSGLTLTQEALEVSTSKYDLSFALTPGLSGLDGVIEYNTDLYEAETIRRMGDHYKMLLSSIVADPSCPVNKLELLDITERRDLLERFQGDRVPLPTGATLVSMFGSQAKLSPGSLALVYEGRELSYGDLDALSDRLGCYLRDYGVGRDVLVPLCIERGIEMVVGILGILKAGGAYVPIDPEYPMDRISYILEDTGGGIAVSSAACYKLIERENIKVIRLDENYQELSGYPAEPPHRIDELSHLAYIIYTSGSTGRPKGVAMSEGALLNMITWHNKSIKGGSHSRALQYASINFDVSFQEIFSMLCFGGSLVLISEESRREMQEVLQVIDKYAVNHLFVPYVVLKNIVESAIESNLYPDSLEMIFTAGEQLILSEDIENFVNKTGALLYNHYGPSEAHVVSSYQVMPSDYSNRTIPPIGRPIANTRIYILDRGGMLCPVGVPGELYIGGAGVGRGYLNQAELSSEKFIGDRFSGEGKMYRTGDIGRWLNDGNIEFQGRNDDQVKIRGYRIELGEIENALNTYGGIKQSVVQSLESEAGDKYLVGYYVSETAIDELMLRAHLVRYLPQYMIPGYLVHLEKLPLTVNGKVDRKSLPGLVDIREVSSGGYVAPETAMERQVSEIWEELLGVDGVGVDDNFFELGGHSLLATRVVSMIRKRLSLDMSVKALFLHPTVRELSGHLEKQGTGESALRPSIGVYERPDRVPLSYSQERLWFIDQLEGSVQYHIPAALRIEGDLDVGLLTSSLRKIVERHEVLRTVIRSEEGVGYQVVLPSGDWALREEGFKRAEEVRELLSSHTGHPFDLSSDYMLRGWLYEIGSSAYMLVLTIHHIASDGWSVPILIEELKSLYNSGLLGEACLLPELPVQYADYSLWQRSYLSGDLLSTKLGYWQEALSGLLPLDLPTDHLRPALQGRRGSVCHFHIGAEISAGLTDLGLGHGSTLFMTLLSGLQVLLYRYSGQSDICVGSPVANREQHEIGGLIGFFVNMLALRVQVDGRESFLGHLDQVRRVTLGAYEHQDVPFEKVVDGVSWERDPGRSPLFQVLFTLQHNDTPGSSGLSELSGLTLTQEALEVSTSKYDLSFALTPGLSGLDGVIEYNTDLYEAETIRRMGDHYKMLLSSIVADPSCPVNKLELMNEDEQKLMKKLLDTHKITGEFCELTLIDLFESTARRIPHKIAVNDSNRSLTYKELSGKVNQLTNYIISTGIGENAVIGLLVERNVDMLIGILAIMKSGRTYLPLNTENPDERLKFIINDANAELVLIGVDYDKIKNMKKIDQIDLNNWDKIAEFSTEEPNLNLHADKIAYIIYTSGSTGAPKGVIVTHGSISGSIKAQQKIFNYDESDLVLQFLSYSFDASIAEIFLAIEAGSTLCIIDEDDKKDTFLLEKFIKDNEITIVTMPISYLRELPISKLDSVKKIISGGEIQDKRFIDEFKLQGTYYNAYGPTEYSVCATIFEINSQTVFKGENVPIGTPIEDTLIYIVNESMVMQPIGVPGEIYIAGWGIAKGYLNNDTLSSEKFIRDSFSGKGKMYRTGDIGRWLSDGNIEFQGRNDDQVKIRGYRIELGEIENALNTYGGIKQSVVQSLESEAGDKYLVGYYVSETAIDELMLRAHLVRYLPQYMIPGYLVHLEKLPLTVNGKVDRKSLPGLVDIREVSSGGYVAPETAMERQVSEIWEELLGVDGVGVDDNFFELGGHSLLATRVVSMIRKRLSLDMSVKALFLHPTVRELSGHLEKQGTGESALRPSIGVYERPDRVPLSYSQERLWFIDQLEGSVQYHIPAALRIEGDLDVGLLTSSLRKIVERHEVLRTVIRSEEGVGYQVVLPSGDWALREEGFKRAEEVRELLSSHTGHPFDLSSDYMLRGWLYEIGSSAYMLVLTIHHIASDGWSVPILIEELKSLYNSGLLGEACLLPELPVQYADYSLWQRSYLSGDLLSTKLGYWQEALSGLLPLDLPTDHLRPALQGRRGSVCHFHIGAEISAGLTDLGLGHGSTLFMTLLSGLQVLLYRYSGQSDICVGSPVANREQHEIGGLIGFFVNMLALRVQVDGRESFLGHLDQVRRVTLGAYEHQDVPFEKVVDGVSWERDPGRSPLFQVSFTLHNDTPGSSGLSELSGLTLTQEALEVSTSKYDLSFALTPGLSGLDGVIEYNTDLYEAETIRRMGDHYKMLLSSIVADPSCPVNKLELLTILEKDELLINFQGAKVEGIGHETIISMFLAQVKKIPNLIAFQYEADQLTYRELDRRSNQLGNYLISQGVTTDSLIPICIERGVNMIIGVLGIIKAGGAYVPIDPEYPFERIKYMLEDTKAPIFLGSSVTTANLPMDPSQNWILLDADAGLIYKYPETAPEVNLSPTNIAYVMYTSGSTGKPKGVMIDHRNVVSLINGTAYISCEKQDIVLGTGSFSFDATTFEYWSTLLNGAKLIMASKDTLLNVDLLKQEIVANQVTKLFITTSWFNQLIDLDVSVFSNLKTVLFGGERFSEAHVSKIVSECPDVDIIHVYGPTEATTFSLFYPVAKGYRSGVVPIGRPLNNRSCYILDHAGNLCPIGVHGELYIGGDGVAQGYLNQLPLTEKKFIRDPYNTISGAKLYSTGDIGRWLNDGNIEFLGRNDDQVKIRGHRIELGEIESVIYESDFIKQLLLTVEKNENNDNHLICYLIPESIFQKENLFAYLSERLPDYMIPSQYIVLEKFPLTNNGKIDRKLLAGLTSTDHQTIYVAPSTDVEIRLAAIWRSLLDVDEVGLHDNFFELGGHSLLAINLIKAIREEFAVDISISTIFQNPDFTQLSNFMQILIDNTLGEFEDYEQIEL